MANKDFKVKNGIDVSTPIPVSMGGTGQTSTTNTLNSLLPLQTSNSGKVLSTDGTNTSWVAQAVAYQRGGTASRPVGPTVGDLYYNTDTNIFEQYTSLGWFAIAVAPGAPSGVTATNQPTSRAYNNGQMSVAFTPNTNAGAPSSFIVTPTPTTSPSTFTGTSSPITVTGLASSTSYTYTVSATSAYGTSSASSSSTGVTATTVPQAPTIGTATAGDTSATVTYTAGGTGGASATYTATSSPGGFTGTGSSPITISGLTNGTSYTFTVTATNANGTSLASVASNSIVPDIQISNNFVSLATATGTGSSGSILLNNIPQGYTHLQIRYWAKSSWSPGSVSDVIQVRINEDSTAGAYRAYSMYTNGVGSISSSDTGTSATYWGDNAFMCASTNPTNVGGVGILDINNYSSSTQKKGARFTTAVPSNSYYTGNYMELGMGSASYNSTSPITQIRFTCNGNFSTDTYFALYGILI